MAVLANPPYLQFFDANGKPLEGGYVETYAAGTTTRKATYTDATATATAPNPIQLNASGIPESGNGSIWIDGSYKFIVYDQFGVEVETTDNVTSFSPSNIMSSPPFFDSFTGNGSQTTFTLSDDLGTDRNGIQVFISSPIQPSIKNGDFATDTDWTKGTGWVIGSGVATATTASTALSQVTTRPLVQGQAYSVSYTMTRSAGSLTPSIGGNDGTIRSVAGTFNEVIVAGSNQNVSFTGTGFTGTLDNVSVTPVMPLGYEVQNPSSYTLNGSSLVFATAPANNASIFVFAPSLAAGQAAISAAAADASATAAANSASSAAAAASSAAAYAVAKLGWNFSSTTTMANPGTGFLRLNDSTLSAVTAMAISNLSSDAGNPDLSGWTSTWDDSLGSPKGGIYLFKDNANFVIYNITGSNVDNTGWKQITLSYMAGNGTLTNNDQLKIGFTAYGSSTVTGGITALTGDVTASGSGSVAATISPNTITTGKILDSNVTLQKIQNATANNKLLGSGAAGINTPYSEITLGSGLNMTGTTLSVTGTNPIKAFAKFSVSGGVATVISQFNIASIVRTGVGLYTVTFSTPLANADYIVSPSLTYIGSITSVAVAAGTTPTTNSFILQSKQYNNVTADASVIYFTVTGT